MKKYSWILVFVLLLAGCSMETTQKIKIELPSLPEVRLDGNREIIIANFWLDKEIKDFDLNRDLVKYFQEEMKRPFKGKLSTTTVLWDDADLPQKKDFWKGAAGEGRDAIFLTGKVQFGQELRKALLANEKRAIDDGPFAKERPWAERRNFSLKLEVFLIQAASGEVLFQKEYQEQMNYPNVKQTAEFAFFDLLQRVKPKLFLVLFGTDRIQERYLLSK